MLIWAERGRRTGNQATDNEIRKKMNITGFDRHLVKPLRQIKVKEKIGQAAKRESVGP